MGPTPPELREEVAGVTWWHTIDLGHGIVTPGFDKTPQKLKTLHLPDSFRGKTVLDIGTWDGFFAFEAERRGAERVVATDRSVWHNQAFGRRGFDIAHRALDSKVEALELDIFEHSPENPGTFDVVLFLGVLYHMRHPMLALEHLYSVTGEMAVLETAMDCMMTRRAAAAFYPSNELSSDESNWWGPNTAAVVGLLTSVGFKRVEVKFLSPFVTRVGRAAKGRTSGKRFLPALAQGRGVFHAYK